jgi:hypothetical protein
MADIKDYIKRLQNGTVSLEEQQIALGKIEETIKVAKQKRDEAVGQKADMVVEALKQIESRLNEKYEELLQTPAMVGEQGPKGPAGRDGKDGLNGRDGVNGVDGKDGKDGVDGSDGISVVDARVDFDGGLVITLSDGSEIDAGQIFSPEVAQNIQIFKGGGGGTSLPNQSGNSGKYLTTNGSELSWATVSGGGGSGTVTSVAMSVPTGLTVSGSPITTDGTLAVSYTAGYAIPTTAKQTEWDTAYGWGNHASAGYATTSGTQTLTNKRINPRAVAAGSTSGNLTPNGDTTDVFNAFGLTGAITILTPSGTPVDGQRLMIRLEDDGTGRAITWTTSSGAFRAIGVTLPTTTVATKITYVGCVYNSTDVFWDVIAVATQA